MEIVGVIGDAANVEVVCEELEGWELLKSRESNGKLLEVQKGRKEGRWQGGLGRAFRWKEYVN